MSRINVLWIIDHVCYDGSLHGGGRLFWNLLPKFDDERYNVIPCLLRADEEIEEVFKNSPVPVRIMNKGKFDVTTLWAILRLIRTEKIDVMHLHCYGASLFGRIASLITGVPAIIHDYDTAIYFPYPPYLWLADRLLKSSTRRAIAASPMVKDYFVNRRAIDPDKITLAYHAIPMEKFTPAPDAEIARVKGELGIGENEKVIGTVTKLGPERGNKMLLRAAAKTLDRLSNARFVVIYKPTIFHRRPSGRYVDFDGAESESELSELEAYAAELGIADRLMFVIEPDDLEPYIGAFDIFVAPYLNQRFSSVNLLEAMAVGKPVIATSIGEQRDIIRSGVNGYLVPVHDEQAMADRIVQLASNDGELERLGKQAAIDAENYSVNGYVRMLQEWYEELSAKPKTDAVRAG
ncbi:MAG: glycosyltransferase [Chloroflexi bacterium]|nr:glycosyltransferase [Chloroflexota bacterium]